MNMAPVQAEIAACGFRTIGGAATLADIATLPGQLPAAYVVTETESSADLQSGGGVFEQIDTVIFAVVIVVAAGAANRELPTDEIETLKEAAKGRLRAWTHPDSDRPTAYRGARLVGVGNGRVSMMLRFETVQRVRITRAGV